MKEQTKRERYRMMNAQLEIERASFISHWKDIGDHVLPRRVRLNATDTNRGDRRNQKIIDSTASISVRTLRSGMMGGVTSPARPWFHLSVPTPEIADLLTVKTWLDTVASRMSNVFLKSNLYQTLPVVYGDMGAFGTSAMLVEEDFDQVVRFYAFPIGTYKIATNERGKVDVFIRDFRMTVRQILSRWGKKIGPGPCDYDFSNMSRTIQEACSRGQFEQWIDVRHVICPNSEYDAKKLHSKFKKYTSDYFEVGTAGNNGQPVRPEDDDKYLSEMGYDYFPVLCPRWEVAAEDAYGTSCPGMDALPDIKQLMLMQKRKAQASEKSINPPMTGPSSLRTTTASTLPGDITFVDEQAGTAGFRPVYQIQPNLAEYSADIREIQERIKTVFFENLFLMLEGDNRSGVTATEIDERKEEKLLALGPVLEQLNQDLLDPLIDIVFEIMMKRSQDASGTFYQNPMLPEPPDELKKIELKIEYVSVMAQAQKLVGISGIERFTSYYGSVLQLDPDARDGVDTDELLQTYADITSIAPKIMRSAEDRDKIRQQKAQAQAQAQQAEAFKNGAGAAKDLSQADTGGNNALTQLMNQANAGNLTQ